MEKEELLIEEYKLAQQFIIHYEKLIWYIGSILNSSIVVLTGFLVKESNYSHFWVVILLSLLFSFIWYRFECRHRQINLQKLRRMHEIENELGFKQSLYVVDFDKTNRPFFTSHRLITMTCILIPIVLLLIWISSWIGKT